MLNGTNDMPIESQCWSYNTPKAASCAIKHNSIKMDSSFVRNRNLQLLSSRNKPTELEVRVFESAGMLQVSARFHISYNSNEQLQSLCCLHTIWLIQRYTHACQKDINNFLLNILQFAELACTAYSIFISVHSTFFNYFARTCNSTCL